MKNVHLIRKISKLILESILLEGKDVDRQVKAALSDYWNKYSNYGYVISDQKIDRWAKMINEIPQVKRSQNGKDAIPVARWAAGEWEPEKAIEKIKDLLNRKDKLEKTIKNKSLTELYDLYPTFKKFEFLINDEEEKIINGFDDDYEPEEDVDDLTDEERIRLIRADLGKPTFSDPGVVDVYRADTKKQSIKYSEGYKWCIGYKTANNQFYHYSSIDRGATYFCFFKKKQPEFQDYACVIHARIDDDNIYYVVTNAENTFSNKVYRKSEVLRYYPGLKNVIDEFAPLSEEKSQNLEFESDLEDYNLKSEPLPLSFLTDSDDLNYSLAKGYTRYSRKTLRKLLMKNIILSDKLFQFIFEHFENGKLRPDDKDNLIGIYLRLAEHPLTPKQRELLKGSSVLKYHDKLISNKMISKQKAELEKFNTSTKRGITTLTVDDEDECYNFYTKIPDVRLSIKNGHVSVSPNCNSLEGLPYGDEQFGLYIQYNRFIERINPGEVVNYASITIESCSALNDISFENIGDEFVVSNCDELETIKISGEIYGESEITLQYLPILKKLDFNLKTVDLSIDSCPNLRINPGDLNIQHVNKLILKQELEMTDFNWLSSIGRIEEIIIEDGNEDEPIIKLLDFVDESPNLNIDQISILKDPSYIYSELEKRIFSFKRNNKKTQLFLFGGDR